MFARVITAQVTGQGFEKLIELAKAQLVGARTRPGFESYEMLADDATGKVVVTSYWTTREHMEESAQGTPDGVHDQGLETAGIASVCLQTYEVKLRV